MNETFWLNRARLEALRFNFGWWLQKFLPWVLASGLLGAIGVLALTSARLTPSWALAGVLAILLCGMVVAWVTSRKKYLTTRESLTRLDADLKLRTRLTSAAEGIGSWPPPQENASLALGWNWKSLLWPPAAAFALLFAAFLIPPPSLQAKAAHAHSEPPAWTDAQAKIDALREEEVTQQESLEEFQKTLDALRKQPGDQWFRQESLEAGDHLQAQLNQSLAELQKNLETALGAMEASRMIEQSQMQALNQPLDKALQEALQGMEMGKLPLNPELLSKLKNLDPSKVRKMSAEEWKALSERMQAAMGTCSNGFCPGGKEAADAVMALLSMPGRGGVERGPGAAPLTLSDFETQLDTDKVETVENDDLSRAAMGDLMGLGSGKHEVDQATWTGPQAGGAMSSTGSGGDAVWEQSATPAEQDALRRFFQ